MDVAGEESAVSPVVGTVRLSVAEGFGANILAPAFPAFVDRRPGMKVELVASPGYLSPTTREVDIAITSNPPSSTRLVVEALTDYEIGLYASQQYLNDHGEPQDRDDLKNFDFIGYIDDLIYTSELRFLDSFNPDLRRRLACSSLKAQTVLAAANGGIGAFPHFLVEGIPLVRVLPKESTVRTYWIATHVDLYETARMRAVRSWMFDVVKQNRHRLTPLKAARAP